MLFSEMAKMNYLETTILLTILAVSDSQGIYIPLIEYDTLTENSRTNACLHGKNLSLKI